MAGHMPTSKFFPIPWSFSVTRILPVTISLTKCTWWKGRCRRNQALLTLYRSRAQSSFDTFNSMNAEDRVSLTPQPLATIMKTFSKSMPRRLIVVFSLITVPALYSQTSPKDFVAESDKTMAIARGYFLKGDISKASAEIHKAAVLVKQDSLEVAADCKRGLEDAARELERLGEDVKKGAAKSDADLNRVFAKTDYALATGWHRTAEQSGKAGRDEALKRASAALLGAAKWSATKPKGATQSPLKAVEQSDQTVVTDLKAGVQNTGNSSKESKEGVEEGRKR
jgi:hypothetical protein